MRKFAPILDIMYLSRIGANRYCEKMATSLENIDKSKVSADRIEGLDAKIQAELSTAVTGAASTIVTTDLTANRAVISNGNGKVAVSSTTSTELGYVHGVTSAIQTQLGNKQDILVSGTNIKTINGNSVLGSGDVSISTVATWGNITGTLSNQTDLNNALSGKVNTSNLATCHVVIDTYENGASWYRVYDDGWVEQGGYLENVSNGALVTLLKPFDTNNYRLLFGGYATGSYSVGYNNPTSEGFTFYTSYNGAYVNWYACGRGA